MKKICAVIILILILVIGVVLLLKYLNNNESNPNIEINDELSYLPPESYTPSEEDKKNYSSISEIGITSEDEIRLVMWQLKRAGCSQIEKISQEPNGCYDIVDSANNTYVAYVDNR